MKIAEACILPELTALSGKIGCYYKNLATGETCTYHADIPVVAASVIKLYVMVEAFAQAEEGKLAMDQEVTIHRKDCVPSCGVLTYLHDEVKLQVIDLITLMIIVSDNTATNVLIDLLGIDKINARIRSLGFEKTILNRKLYDEEKAKLGLQNYITAEEAGALLEMMYRGTLVSEAASARMISILKDQQLNHKIPYLIEQMPQAPQIAHKTGEDDGTTHDVAVIFAKEPFILCICSNDTDVTELEPAMGRIAKKLLELPEGLQWKCGIPPSPDMRG